MWKDPEFADGFSPLTAVQGRWLRRDVERILVPKFLMGTWASPSAVLLLGKMAPSSWGKDPVDSDGLPFLCWEFFFEVKISSSSLRLLVEVLGCCVVCGEFQVVCVVSTLVWFSGKGGRRPSP